jgi:hypothetical protein
MIIVIDLRIIYIVGSFRIRIVLGFGILCDTLAELDQSPQTYYWI